MTRFAGHSDITNFLQRNQFADKVGAAGMNAYADQAIGGFLQDAAVTAGGMKTDQLSEIGKIRRKAGASIASQNASSMLTNSAITGIGSVVGGAIRGGHFGGGPVTSAHKGLGGFGPVASGKAYGSFLEGTAGTIGIGPFASGDIYGSFLSRR